MEQFLIKLSLAHTRTQKTDTQQETLNHWAPGAHDLRIDNNTWAVVFTPLSYFSCQHRAHSCSHKDAPVHWHVRKDFESLFCQTAQPLIFALEKARATRNSCSEPVGGSIGRLPAVPWETVRGLTSEGGEWAPSGEGSGAQRGGPL